MHLLETELEDKQRDGGDMSVYHIVHRMRTVHLGDSSLSPIQSNDAIAPHTSPCRPGLRYSAGYPGHITEISQQCMGHSLTDATAFYPLWRLVLAYWFPANQGYSLAENLEFMDFQWRNIEVFFREQPFLFLQISGVSDMRSEVTRGALKERGNKLFDVGALWSGHPALCIISAMGTRWNGFIRSTEMTSETAQEVLIDDWFGGWSEDVSSQGSHDALSLFFGSLKSSLQYVQ